MSVGYLSNRLTTFGNDKAIGEGVGLRVGKNFNLTYNLNMTTSLLGNFASLRSDIDSGINKTVFFDSEIAEYGISQRLSYDLNSSNTIFRPFLEAQISRGNMSTDLVGFDSYSQDAKYTKYGAAIGFQIVLENNIVPFAIYDVSKSKAYSITHTEGLSSSSLFNTNTTFVHQEIRTVTSRTLIIGLGFLF
ncbi:MAG: hypothetical protein Q7U04_02005 [Bacteriovorax sp.]|nr:hypothetical protein [Bacteriovorax sp.]